jgi:hypothetical protein
MRKLSLAIAFCGDSNVVFLVRIRTSVFNTMREALMTNLKEKSFLPFHC